MNKYKKPLDDNLLIRIFHIHSFSLLYQRLFRPISPSDFYDLPEDTQPDKLKQSYLQVKSTLPKQTQSINKIIMKMFRWDLAIGIVMSFIVAFLALESPLILKMILEYIEKREVTEYERSKVNQYVWTWLGMFFVKIFFTEMTDRIFFRIGVKIELLLTTLFMEKIVKIPNIQGENNKAEIMNYLTVEIRRVHTFFKKGSYLFSQPPMLVLALVVIFLQGKEFGMLLFQVLLGMVIINIIVDTRMEECHHHKEEYLEKRINTGIELLKQHRELKTLGWQSMIPQCSSFYRTQENTQNTKYLFFKRINESLLVITTGVFFSIMFSLRYQNSTPAFSNLTLSDVFTITIFIYILKNPIKNIRYTMTYFRSMMKALHEIEEFMNSQELKRVNIINYDCEKGTLECSNIVVRGIDTCPDSEEEMMNLKTLVLKKKLSIEENDVIKHELVMDLDIEVSAGDKISIHSDSYQGSTFLATIAGIINCDCGIIMHGGRITYQNSQIWLMEDSIQANVLIGRPFDKERLKLVYDVSGLSEELELFLFKQRTKINQLIQLTEGQKRKIVLARTLYTQADIYLLDFPFKGLAFEASSDIMTRIKIYYPDQTFIVSTFFPHLSAFDKSLIFSNGRAIEFSPIDIYRLPQFSSRISKLQSTILEQRTEIHLELKDAWNKQKLFQQKVDNRRQIAGKMKSAVRHLLNILRVVGKEKLSQMIKNNVDLKGVAERKALIQQDRDSLPYLLGTIKAITKNVSTRAIVAVLVIVSLCEGIKLFMNSMFGAMTEETRPDAQRSLLRQYILLTVILFVAEVAWGLIEGRISNTVSNQIAENMMVSLANASPENIQSKNIYNLAEDSNRDYEEVFMLSHRALLSYLNIIVLLNTICLLLYLGPQLLLVLVLLMGFNVLFFRHLLITKRQVFRFKHKITDQSYSAVAELVNGISTLRHQADLPYFIQKQIDFVKDYTVYTLNQRSSLHAMKMVSELNTLIMTFWVMNYAVNNKELFFGYEIPILFTAIYYCVRLSGLVYLIVEDLSEIDNIIQVNILPSMEIVEFPQEPSEHRLHKPEAWPKNNILSFENVTLVSLNSKVQLIKDMSFQVESGQRAALFGNIESGTEYIIKLINKEINSSKGIHAVAGNIRIGEECIQTIDQKYVREQVFRLISDPFIISGTLRTNVDPYNDYRDRDILRMMDLINIKKYMPKECQHQNLLEYKVTYQSISFELKQAVDVVRVLLRKPSILISEMINFLEADEIIENYLAATTIIYVNPMIKTVKKCNVSKILFVWKGVLVENGPTSEILKSKNSMFVKKYLPTHQGNVKERIENIKEKTQTMRQRKKSKSFKPEEVEIRQ